MSIKNKEMFLTVLEAGVCTVWKLMPFVVSRSDCATVFCGCPLQDYLSQLKMLQVLTLTSQQSSFTLCLHVPITLVSTTRVLYGEDL